uniref:Twin-arginine translocation signal domain-containing protein n=1 Tax=Meloidogyne hapla TaxID=6305 RepID=A0A1I8BAV1_MELHA
MPNPEKFDLNAGDFGSDVLIQPIEKQRRRRGTLLKAAGGGAALGLGAVMLHKAFKKKN